MKRPTNCVLTSCPVHFVDLHRVSIIVKQQLGASTSYELELTCNSIPDFHYYSNPLKEKLSKSKNTGAISPELSGLATEFIIQSVCVTLFVLTVLKGSYRFLILRKLQYLRNGE